jgi:hypothetical protein
MALKAEGDHLREFHDAMKIAVSSATAMGFYRNQQGWMRIAALLDEVAKKARELATRRAH